VVGVVVMLLVGGLASEQASTTPISKKTDPITYVGPQVRDGFIDTDGDIADSIKDIKNEGLQ
jgi:hypothetical protein